MCVICHRLWSSLIHNLHSWWAKKKCDFINCRYLIYTTYETETVKLPIGSQGPTAGTHAGTQNIYFPQPSQDFYLDKNTCYLVSNSVNGKLIYINICFKDLKIYLFNSMKSGTLQHFNIIHITKTCIRTGHIL